MKSLYVAVFLGLAVAMTACKGVSDATNDKLAITAIPDVAYIVPGSSDYNLCYDSEIAEPRIAYTSLTTVWSYASSDFQPVILKLIFKNNPYIEDHTRGLVDGDATLAYWMSNGAYDASLPAGSYTSRCPFASGGIPIKAAYQDRKFSTTGTIELIGLYTDATDGIVKSVKTSIKVKVFYEP